MKFHPVMPEDQLIDQIRSVMAPANPVPGAAFASDPGRMAGIGDRIEAFRSGERRQVGPAPRRERGRAVRVLGPVLSGLAVLGVVAGLALAAGPFAGPKPAGQAGSGTGMPPFYVSIDGQVGRNVAVTVHDSQNGRTLSSIKIPRSLRPLPLITAASSDREFILVSRPYAPVSAAASVIGVLRLTAAGRVASLKMLPFDATPRGSRQTVLGIALSPDGKRLAVASDLLTQSDYSPQESEITVFSLTTGASRTWLAPGDVAIARDPAWIGGNTELAFLWWDRIRTSPEYSARTAVREIDTATPGGDLLNSRVLVTGGGDLGFITSAYASPNGGPIIATSVVNNPSMGSKGTATLRLLALSPGTGKIVKTIAEQKFRYSSELMEDPADFRFLLLSQDPTGPYQLVRCPYFGRLDNGTFTLLRPEHAGPLELNVVVAGW
jgi:hypothetical protein